MDPPNDSRTLAFTTTFNFRDLGGYPGLDGRTVRWRRLFRSDSLHRLTGADDAAFAALNVRTVIDLRRPTEVDRDGRVPAYDGLTYHHLEVEHTDWQLRRYSPDDPLERWLADRYLELSEEGIGGVGAALAVLADAEAAPAVVHCAAGKDRTGVVCAMTLALVGVADDVIAEDYALSTAAAARFTAWFRTAYPDQPDLPTNFLASPAGAMRLFLTDLRARHGSVERYASDAGLAARQVADLRRHLLTA